MSAHEVVDELLEGVDGLVLASHDTDVRVGFAPGAGMVGYSLCHRGEELLGQRGGLSAYTERGSTFGIPLLHPWANRLSARSYCVSGQETALDPERSPVRLGPKGPPIHGVLAALPSGSSRAAMRPESRRRYEHGSSSAYMTSCLPRFPSRTSCRWRPAWPATCSPSRRQ